MSGSRRHAVDEQGAVFGDFLEVFGEVIQWDAEASRDVFLFALARGADVDE